MKYRYTAYFYPDEEEQGYDVCVPSLDIEAGMPNTRLKDCERLIRSEIEDVLSVYEYDGEEFPPDTGEPEAGYEASKVIEGDTAGVIRGIKRVY